MPCTQYFGRDLWWIRSKKHPGRQVGIHKLPGRGVSLFEARVKVPTYVDVFFSMHVRCSAQQESKAESVFFVIASPSFMLAGYDSRDLLVEKRKEP